MTTEPRYQLAVFSADHGQAIHVFLSREQLRELFVGISAVSRRLSPIIQVSDRILLWEASYTLPAGPEPAPEPQEQLSLTPDASAAAPHSPEGQRPDDNPPEGRERPPRSPANGKPRRPIRECALPACSARFRPRRSNQVFCSKRCADRASRARRP